jgi:5-methyltetrahydropteroyltriglutamate--homocysteine methyltransferase
VIARFLENQYYSTHEVYLFALADATKVEYDTIYQAGFLLQLDCPDLTGNRQIRGAEQGAGYLA